MLRSVGVNKQTQFVHNSGTGSAFLNMLDCLRVLTPWLGTHLYSFKCALEEDYSALEVALTEIAKVRVALETHTNKHTQETHTLTHTHMPWAPLQILPVTQTMCDIGDLSLKILKSKHTQTSIDELDEQLVAVLTQTLSETADAHLNTLTHVVKQIKNTEGTIIHMHSADALQGLVSFVSGEVFIVSTWIHIILPVLSPKKHTKSSFKKKFKTLISTLTHKMHLCAEMLIDLQKAIAQKQELRKQTQDSNNPWAAIVHCNASLTHTRKCVYDTYLASIAHWSGEIISIISKRNSFLKSLKL